MPTSLTLKNIPDVVYSKLRAQATLNRRSLNSEVIVCLETILNKESSANHEKLERIRSLRASLGNIQCSLEDFQAFKQMGRE